MSTNVFEHEQILIMDISQEERADQRLQKEAQVTLYRNYRMGDFPDIQISYSSLITPLQALSQVGLLPVILQMYIACNELRKVNYIPAHFPLERSSCSQTVVQLPVCWYTSRDGKPETKRGKCEN